MGCWLSRFSGSGVCGMRRRGTKIPVVAGDLPVEEHVFHFWPLPNVVNDHVAAGEEVFPVHHHANVRQPAAQVPRYQVAWSVILGPIRNRQRLALAAEENH